MALYKNLTGETTRIGYTVKVSPDDPQAITYSTAGDSNIIGVIVTSVPRYAMTEVATTGVAKVFCYERVVQGAVIRSQKAGDNISRGTCKAVGGSDTTYFKVGTALESGKGLIRTALGFQYLSAGGSGSVTSTELSVVNARVTSVNSTISTLDNAISVVSNALSALEVRVSTLSAVPPGSASITSAEYTSLVNRVSANSAVGGGGSVTSDELSVVEARVNTLSNAVSNETSNRVSASAVLDAKISALSALVISGIASVDGRATSLETKISTLSALVISGIASVDSRVDVVSNNLSNEISNRTSADGVLANAISVLSTTLSPYYAFPTGLSVTAGTLVSGGFSGLSAFNGEAVLVSELVSTIPFAMTLQLSAVSQTPNRLLIRAWYEGNAAHSVGVDIFNHTTSLWDNYGKIPTDTALRYYEFNIYTGANHVSTSNARVRIVHASGGTNTHSFQLDYLTLAKLIEGAGITNHNALQGLADDDHLQYALADGSRGFTVISDAVSALSTLVVNGLASADTQRSTLSALVVSGLASVDGRATSLDNAISVVSNALSALEVRVSTLSAAPGGGGSVTSNEFSALEVRVSALSNSISNEISNRTSASAVLDGKISVLSAVVVSGIASVDARVDVVSNQVSILSDRISNEISNRTSASAILDAKISSLSTLFINLSQNVSVISNAISALEVRVSTLSAAGGASVTSNELSALEARVSAISATVATSNVVSAFMARWSMAVMSAPATISASALTGVSGTTITISANNYYFVEGKFAINIPNTVSLKKYGLTFPAMNTCRGLMRATHSASPTAINTSAIWQYPINEDNSGSALINATSVAFNTSANYVEFEAIMLPSATGVVYFMVGAQATTGAAIVKTGSFIKTEKYR